MAVPTMKLLSSTRPRHGRRPCQNVEGRWQIWDLRFQIEQGRARRAARLAVGASETQPQPRAHAPRAKCRVKADISEGQMSERWGYP
jgi:hypothetical protein